MNNIPGIDQTGDDNCISAFSPTDGERSTANSRIVASPALKILTSIRTTRYSLLHRLFESSAQTRPYVTFKRILLLYVTAVAATYLPIFLTAYLWFRSHPQAGQLVKIPLATDYNLPFMFLITLPLFAVFTVTDHKVLMLALRHLIDEKTLEIEEPDATSLAKRWNRLFRLANTIAYSTGTAVGLLVVAINYYVYSNPEVGYWAAPGGEFQWPGFMFLYGVFIFWAVIAVYIVRSGFIVFFLRDLVRNSRINVVPFHPDGCGGLRAVGAVGLRNQYLLSTGGVNLVILFMVNRMVLDDLGLRTLLEAAVVAYLFFGPIVFIGPLLPFRQAMVRGKTELMNILARRLQSELARIRIQLASGEICKADEEFLDRLRKLGSLFNELPVWPFNPATGKKFISAYIVPALSLVPVVFKPLLDKMAEALRQWLTT